MALVLKAGLATITLVYLFSTPHAVASPAEGLDHLQACHNAELGSDVKPGEDFFIQDNFSSTNILSNKLMLVDGVPRGWAFKYRDGKISDKLFFDDYGQLDSTKGCFFEHVNNDTFTSSGSGTKRPILMLKNGKPHNGFFERGNEQDAFYSKMYFKNGMAHGQAHNKGFNESFLADTEEKGIFYNGFKNGKFWLKWTAMIGAQGFDVENYVKFDVYYEMGKLVDKKITYAWPEEVENNSILLQLVKLSERD